MKRCSQQLSDGNTKLDFSWSTPTGWLDSNQLKLDSVVLSCTHLLLPQYEHSSRSNVVSGCQRVTLTPQFPPLEGLPGSSLLAPAHTDVLPATSGEVQRQLRHLGIGEEKGNADEVCILMFLRHIWRWHLISLSRLQGTKAAYYTAFPLSQRHSAASKDTELFLQASITVMTSLNYSYSHCTALYKPVMLSRWRISLSFKYMNEAV